MREPIDRPPVEFSRVVSIARLADDEALHQIAANEAERTALARRFGLVALDEFTAVVRLRREAPGSIRARATIEAAVVQECVVTLEPFASRVAEDFELVYRRGAAPGGTLEVGDDDVENLVGDEIDIGEAVAQQLSLALDPFPHAPDAALPDAVAGPPEEAQGSALEAAARHPFAELAKLAKK